MAHMNMNRLPGDDSDSYFIRVHYSKPETWRSGFWQWFTSCSGCQLVKVYEDDLLAGLTIGKVGNNSFSVKCGDSVISPIDCIKPFTQLQTRLRTAKQNRQ